MLKWLRAFLAPRRTPELREWFRVKWDDLEVHVEASPPGREAWVASFVWVDVVRVCFEADATALTDSVYVFITARPESYAIPTDADGGAAFWDELVRRGLFNAE